MVFAHIFANNHHLRQIVLFVSEIGSLSRTIGRIVSIFVLLSSIILDQSRSWAGFEGHVFHHLVIHIFSVLHVVVVGRADGQIECIDFLFLPFPSNGYLFFHVLFLSSRVSGV
jgi:hypothetical protein